MSNIIEELDSYAGVTEVYYSTKIDRLILVYIMYSSNIVEYDERYTSMKDFDLLGELRINGYEKIGEL